MNTLPSNIPNVLQPLLLVALFIAGTASAETRDVHKDLLYPEKCLECHTEKPASNPGEICTGKKSAPIKNNVTEMCTSCHDYGDRSHPTDVEVDFNVPGDLPIMNGRITCVTCHYPHANCESEHRFISVSILENIFSGGGKYKTYFLRRSNAHGELCLACHNY